MMQSKPYSAGETIAIIAMLIAIVALFGTIIAAASRDAEKANSFKREIACIESGRNFANGICK